MNAVPAEFVERARALASGALQPVPTKDAATVVLLRDASGRAGVEAYLLRRVRSMAFAAGMHVFPGGSVDPRDADHGLRWTGPSPDVWGRVLDADPDLARSLVCAAVRETFEESGVLLAGPSDEAVVDDVSGADWERDRQALLVRSVSFAEFLESRDLSIRSDLLGAWAHWITPEVETRRYDTRFFVAEVPAGQRTRDVGGEADVAAWIHVSDALDRHQAGEFVMLPPTAFTLSELAAYDSVAAIRDAAARRELRAILPKVVVDGDAVKFLLPGDPDYPDG